MESGITLEKLDALRRRTGASYAACLDALRAHGGDVCAALGEIECAPGQAGTVLGGVARTAGNILQEGMRTRLAVRRGGTTLVCVPAVVGVAGAVLFPLATVVGVGAALASRASLSLERATSGL